VHEAQTDLRCIGRRRGEALVVLILTGEIGQGHVVQQGGGLGLDLAGGNALRAGIARVGSGGTWTVRQAGAGIVDGNFGSTLAGQTRKVSAALGEGRNGSVFIEGRRGTGAGKREEEKIILVVGEDFRNIRGRQEGDTEAVRSIGGLLNGLTAERKVVSV
jgi:hypothetical protein